jgi:membrane fusion protein, copper/silver efflux system
MNYRRLFIVAVILNIALAAGLIWKWRSSRRPAASSSAEHPPMEGFTAAAPVTNTEQPLAPVQLTAERMQSIGVRTGKAEIQNLSTEIRATGTVDVDERRLAYVQTRYPGWIKNVHANATYQFIRKGEPLFTIYSPELVASEQEYLLARGNVQKLRQSTLMNVSSGAEQLLNSARERLRQWNLSDADIAKLDATGQAISEFTFPSPVSGYVLERMALPNAYVQPEMRLYTVADLSSVWVHAQVFQEDAGKLKPNDAAEVTVDAYPGRTFRGRIEQILPQLDPTTRTLRVRLTMPNPALLLKPGMFVNVVLHGPGVRQLVVPASAVLHSGTRDVVFLDRGNGLFEPRAIQLGSRTTDKVGVLKGVAVGDIVVTSANFLIDSESQLQAAAGAFTPSPSTSTGSAQPTTGQIQSSAELTTDPSPPHKGKNELRVRLAGAGGAPITGAQVSVRFFMAGMPAMGMAEMNVVANLHDAGNGAYNGEIELGSGGTWQVTITAQRDGQMLTTKQFNVSATGGM